MDSKHEWTEPHDGKSYVVKIVAHADSADRFPPTNYDSTIKSNMEEALLQVAPHAESVWAPRRLHLATASRPYRMLISDKHTRGEK
jgi:hypothetical protein